MENLSVSDIDDVILILRHNLSVGVTISGEDAISKTYRLAPHCFDMIYNTDRGSLAKLILMEDHREEVQRLLDMMEM